jgi:hypothetical protein
MLTNPRPGTRCRIHYAASYAASMPHHGALGRIVLAGLPKTVRNHLVELDDKWRVAVPAGNLRKECE